MITVVADTSPIRYPVRLGQIELLRTLYSQITVPEAVFQELGAEGGSHEVREWTLALPSWVVVRSPSSPLPVALPNLHRGESDALALAEELNANLLLIDDRTGARVALERGLTTTGTLGVLVEASQAGLVQIEPILAKLRESNFRATPRLYARALELAAPQPLPPRPPDSTRDD